MRSTAFGATAAQESPPMIDVNPLLRYPLIIVNLLLMIAAGIDVAIAYVDSVVTVDLIVHYRDNDDFMRLIDFMQYNFRCCGITEDGYRDWNSNMYFNCTKTNPSVERCMVPSSCCCYDQEDMVTVLSHRFCGRDALSMSEQEAWKKINTRSCTNVIVSQVKSYSVYITLGCFVVMMFFIVMRYLAMNVQEQIISLTDFYEKYFADIRRGEERKSIIRVQALNSIPKGCVEVRKGARRETRNVPKYNDPVLVNGPPQPAIPTERQQSTAIPTPFRMG